MLGACTEACLPNWQDNSPVLSFLTWTGPSQTRSFPHRQEWALLFSLSLLLHAPSYPWRAPSFRIPDKLRLSLMPQTDEMEKAQIDLGSYYGH